MDKNLDISQFKAVIFDMDGTMVDNSQAHKKAWMEFHKRHGFELSEEEYFKNVSGKRNDMVFKPLFGEMSSEEFTKHEEEKETLYRNLYAPEIEEIPGLGHLMKALKDRGIKLAIATTSNKENRSFVLESLKLTGQFDVIVGSEHVINGKPDPEIYLKAADELGLNPKDCLVFEDTPTGIQAAKNAGMKVVGVLTAHSKDELKEADLLIKDFRELEI